MAKSDSAVKGVDVYRVGALYDLWYLYRIVRVGHFRHLPQELRGQWLRRRRLLRRSHWNGYLAEATELDVNAGHGWTRKRALASLHREVAAARAGEGGQS